MGIRQSHPVRRATPAHLRKLVETGRISEAEADELRTTSDPGQFDDRVRSIRLRHVGARLDEAVAEGRLGRSEADALLGELATVESQRARADLRRALRRGRGDRRG